MEQVKEIFWDFLITLLPAILTVISGFVIWLINKGVERLKAQTKKIDDEVIRNNVNDALYAIRNITTDVVTSLEQTLAKEIREGVADGTYTKDDLKSLAGVALERIKEIIGTQTLSVLESAKINAEKYIEELIETNVYYLKQRAGYPTASTSDTTSPGTEDTTEEMQE